MLHAVDFARLGFGDAATRFPADQFFSAVGFSTQAPFFIWIVCSTTCAGKGPISAFGTT